MDLLPSPREEPHSAVPTAILSQKSSYKTTQVPGVYGEAQQKLKPGYLSSEYPSLPCCWMAAQWHLLGPLSLERQYTLYQTYPRRGTFSPRGIPTPHCLPSAPGLCPPSPREHCCSPSLTLVNGTDFQNLRICAPLWKNLAILSSS